MQLRRTGVFVRVVLAPRWLATGIESGHMVSTLGGETSANGEGEDVGLEDPPDPLLLPCVRPRRHSDLGWKIAAFSGGPRTS